MSNFSERVKFTIDYIGDKLNEKAWREEQIKEFLEIKISEFEAELNQCDKGLDRIDKLKSDSSISLDALKELQGRAKFFRLEQNSLSEDIHYLRKLSLEIPETLEKMKSLKSDKVIQPIHWLKVELPLRQFLDKIINAGLIEKRETEEIIQEHFFVDGKMPTKEPQPIRWNKSNRLINYLFWQLREAGLIDKERKFKIITEHFLNKHGKPLKRDSLKSDIDEIKYNSPKGSSVIDNIIESLQTKHLQ